jgi:hypothetical protein
LTSGYLKSANLVRNSVQQNIAGFWKNESGDNKISVQKDLTFKADLTFTNGTALSFGDLSGRFSRLGASWRFRKVNCEVKTIVVNDTMLVSGGNLCDFGPNIKIQGTYQRSQ